MAKILLVEDDKSLREIYGVRLMAEGYEIVSAGDGEEALAMAIKERPDLIVSDVMMPKISGFDMLDILRSTTETKNVKVIMMTALSSEDQRARGESLGADRYLVKSQVGIEDVVRTVHDVLGDGVPAPAPVVPVTTPVLEPVATPAPTQPTPTAFDTSVAPAPALPEAPAAPAPIEAPVIPEPVAQPVVPTADPFAALPPQPGPVEASAYSAPEPTPVAAPVAEAVPEPGLVVPPAPVEPFVPAAPAPMAAPVAAPTPSSIPLPTAPFSTPAPASLGERVIAPLSEPAADTQGILDISSQMEQALNTPGVAQAPGTPPTV